VRRLACCLLLLLPAGCGYRARFDFPPHIQTFCVNTFRNKTLERNLDFEFTEALIHEILAKTTLRVAPPSKADLVVDGEIEALERHILRSRRYGEKMEARHILYVNVEVLDRKKNTRFFEGEKITSRAEFNLNLGETPRQAREELIRELARRVVSLAFERWPATPVEGKASAE
jgi:hypothetical protein